MSCQTYRLSWGIWPPARVGTRRRRAGAALPGFSGLKNLDSCARSRIWQYLFFGVLKNSLTLLSSKDKELAQDRPLRLRDDTARALSTASESADTHSAPPLAQPERRATPARMGNCTCFTVYR